MRSAEFLRKEAERYGVELFAVSALVENDGKILFLKKIPSDNSEELIVLPNGRVEFGETLVSSLKKKFQKNFNLKVEKIHSFVESHDYSNATGRKIREFVFKVDVEDLKDLDISLFDYTNYLYLDPISDISEFDNLSIPYGLKKVVDKYIFNKKN